MVRSHLLLIFLVCFFFTVIGNGWLNLRPFFSSLLKKKERQTRKESQSQLIRAELGVYSWQRWLATQCLSSSYFLFGFLFFSHCVVVCCKKRPHFVLLVGKCGRMLLLLMIESNRTHVINANETLKKETKREKTVKGRREAKQSNIATAALR